MCGTAQWEWDANRFAYEVTQERCMGCYNKEIAAHDFNDAPGVTIQLSATGTPEALERRRQHDALNQRAED